MNTATPTESQAQAQQPSTSQFFRTIGLAIIIGAVAAVGASVFLTAVELGQHELFTALPNEFGFDQAPWWWASIALFAAVGIVMLARKLPGATMQGPLTGFHFDTPLGKAGSVLLAAAASLIGGFALGPEAPLIVLGTTLGAIFTMKQPEQVRKAAMLIGAAGAIGAVFGNPFITAFMMLEFVAFGLAPAAVLMPIFAALASGYLVSAGVGMIPGLGVHSLAVTGLPAYTEIHFSDLLVAILVAVLAAVVVLATRGWAVSLDRFAQKRPHLGLLVAATATTVALFIAETFFGVGQNQVLFSGNSGMDELIATGSLVTVAVVLVAKIVAFGSALGGGLRGGPIFPATFLGVAVAVLTSLIFPHAHVSALAAAGIAASAAAFTKLPATSALLGALLIAGAGPAVAPFAILGSIVGIASTRLKVSKSQL